MNRDLAAEVAFLTRALKAPTLRESVPRLAERARSENWSHEEFLTACLQREVAARESPFVRVSARRVIYNSLDVDAWLTAKRVEPGSAA